MKRFLLFIPLTAVLLVAAAAAPPAGARTHDCRNLAGGGTRSNPWRIPAPNLKRTVVRCPGFPLGQDPTDYYVFNVPSRIDRDDNVTLRSRPTRLEPTEVALAMDDPGPLALNIRGSRFTRGGYAYRSIRLVEVERLTVGRWFLRAERLRPASAPAYRIAVDLR